MLQDLVLPGQPAPSDLRGGAAGMPGRRRRPAEHRDGERAAPGGEVHPADGVWRRGLLDRAEGGRERATQSCRDRPKMLLRVLLAGRQQRHLQVLRLATDLSVGI